MKRIGFFLLTSVLVALAGCDTLVPEPQPNTPPGNFDALWSDFDRVYALFGVRHVDWDSLYQVYRPQVSDASSAEELASAMCGLLGELQDAHVALFPTGLYSCSADRNDSLACFADGDPFWIEQAFHDQEGVLHRSYLEGERTTGKQVFFSVRSELTAGFRILYLGLDSFREDGYVDWSAIAVRLGAPPECDGLIIDLRHNGGGRGERAIELINALADLPRPCFQISARAGPAHDDFSEPHVVVASPRGKGWGDLPVVILTHRYTASAAERFLLAMRQRPRVTIVGTRTCGIFSSVFRRVLPNRWEYTCSEELVSDPDGVCWEGRGVPPDVQAWNTHEANWSLQDLAMDAGLGVLLEQLGAGDAGGGR